MTQAGMSVGLLCTEASERARNVIALRESRLPEDAFHLVAKDVITRLANRHVNSTATLPPLPDDEIDALSKALISPDRDAGLTLVTEYRGRGTPTDTLYLGYIAGAARRLGDLWDEDEISLADVAIGSNRLYIIMSALRPSLMSLKPERQNSAHALFASTPGETHTLGVTMAADLFRSKGWKIDLKTDLQHNELISEIGHDTYPIIGLSASSAKSIVSLTRLIASLRVSSPTSSILVSGELATIEPQLALLVDADSVALDANSAVGEMQLLLDASV